MNAAQLTVSIIAAYAGVVSTLSLILALKVYRSGNPNVDVDWQYDELDKELTVSILNTGRADVTITAIELFVVHEKIIRQSRSGRTFDLRMEPLIRFQIKRGMRELRVLLSRLASPRIRYCLFGQIVPE